MNYLGDFLKGAVVRGGWNASGADGASITRATNGTVKVYKDWDTATETTTGVTDTEDADILTGVNAFAIDTANSFYAPGSEFQVVLTGATIDGKSVNAVLATFSVQRKSGMKPVVGTAQGGAAGYIDLPTSASSTDGAYNGAVVTITGGTGAGQSRYRGATYTGATRRFTVDPNWDVTPDNTSIVELVVAPPAPTTAPIPVQVTSMATDVLTAAALKADAVTEIQSGLATAAAVSTLTGYVDTEVAAIKAKTDNLPASPAAVSDIPSTSAIATAVWGAATRSLTTFGSLASDVWASGTRTLTSAGSLATDVRDGLLTWEPFTGYSLARLFRVLYATQRGPVTGATGTNPTISAPDNSGAINATIAGNGDRSAVSDSFSNVP